MAVSGDLGEDQGDVVFRGIRQRPNDCVQRANEDRDTALAQKAAERQGIRLSQMALARQLRAQGHAIACSPSRISPKDCQRNASTCPERKDGGLLFRPIKEKRRKTIPLAPEIVAILREQYEAQEKDRVYMGDVWQEHDVVFAQPDGSLIDPRDDWEEWADLLEAAGVEHKGTHAARHTAAPLLLDQGVALAVVQEMLGHSDIRVTRRYTRVASKLTQDAALKMSKTLFGETATENATARAGKPTPVRRTSRSKRIVLAVVLPETDAIDLVDASLSQDDETAARACIRTFIRPLSTFTNFSTPLIPGCTFPQRQFPGAHFSISEATEAPSKNIFPDSKLASLFTFLLVDGLDGSKIID